MTRSSRRHRDALALVAAAACWGIGTVVSKQAVAELPPLTLLATQLAVSVAFLVIVNRLRNESRPTGREGRLLARLGLLNPGLAYALSLIGLTSITASVSVLLWALEPILILGLAAVVLRERVHPLIVGSSGVAIGGLALVTADPAAGGSWLGVGLTVAGVAACAVYTVAARRWLLGTDSTFGVVLAQQLHALALALVVVAGVGLLGGTVLPGHLTLGGAASAAASGLLYYALAYTFYLSALGSVRASVAAGSFYLVPLFGLAAAGLAGERLEPQQWLGAILVVGAVAVITSRAGSPGTAAAGQPSSASASVQMATSPSDSSRW